MPSAAPTTSAEESECVLRWLDGTGTRLVVLEGTWASPSRGAGGWTERFTPVAMPASGADADPRALARPFGRRAATVAS